MNTDNDTNAENPHSTFASQVDDLIKLLEVCHHQASRAGHAAMDAGARINASELFASSGHGMGNDVEEMNTKVMDGE